MNGDALGSLQAALGERYALERELGRGGNAIVYLAHDPKHDRKLAVKVLRPELALAMRAERFLREIQIAAQLSHPNILPLLDSGEAAGLLYYVMPYVEGESLRDRLNREPQLPLPDVVTLTGEVADALAHAHERGIVHRDIKPENILLQARHAVVADFGIARAITVAGGQRVTETGVSLGTPAYMSPEQAGGDPRVDGRSDIYSLGCVVYEMLVGHPPFVGASAQEILARHLVDPVPSLRAVRAAVSEEQEAVIVRALAKSPADRFATADAFGAALAGSATGAAAPARRRRRFSRSTLVGGAVAALLLALVGYWLSRPAPLLGFARRDFVVVAEFQHGPNDAELARALALGLGVGLQQSRHVNVLSRTRIASVLEYMRRPPQASLDETLAREVAQRVGAKGVVVPALGTVGGGFLITLRVVDAASGDVAESFAVRAAREDDLLDALDALLGQLRRRLGESLLGLRSGPRLPAVTTSSLEALKRYAAGRAAWADGRSSEAVSLLDEAIRLDSGFASAYAALGNIHASYVFHQTDKARREFEAALARLDRVGPFERDVIQAEYHYYFGRPEDAIRFERLHLERYPDDIEVRYNLGGSYRTAGKLEQAIEQYREVLRLDPRHAAALINWATCLPAREAIAYYRRAFELRPDWVATGNVNHEYGMTLAVAGQADAAREVFDRRLAQANPNERALAHRSLGQLDLLAGRFAHARPHFEQAVALHLSAGSRPSAGRDRLMGAMGETARGDSVGAVRVLRQAAAEVPLESGWIVVRARIGRAYLAAGAIQAARALFDESERWSRDHVPQDAERRELRLLEAALLTASGHADSALVALRPFATQEPPDVEGTQVLAAAYEQAGRWPEAAAALRALIDREAVKYELLVPWVLAHRRLGSIAERLGRREDAVRSYSRFAELWRGADPEVQAQVADARARASQIAR